MQAISNLWRWAALPRRWLHLWKTSGWPVLDSLPDAPRDLFFVGLFRRGLSRRHSGMVAFISALRGLQGEFWCPELGTVVFSSGLESLSTFTRGGHDALK